MSKVWFVATGNRTAGPYSAAELKAMAAKGDLQPGTLLQKEGMDRPVEARSVRGLFPPPEAEVVMPVAPESPPPAQPAEGEDRADAGAAPAADGPGAGTIILWVLGGIVAFGVAVAAAVYYGLFLLVRWWWTKEPKHAGIPAESPADHLETDPQPVPRRGKLRRLGGAVGGAAGWLGGQAFEAMVEASDGKPPPAVDPGDPRPRLPVEPPRTVAALSGAVVVQVTGDNIAYRARCNYCGHVSSTTAHTTISRGSTLTSGDYHCLQCKQDSPVELQG